MSRVDSPVLEEVADVRPTDWRKRTRPNGTPVITLPNESKPQIVKYDAQSKKRNTHRKSRKVSNKWVLWYNAGHAKDGNTSHGQSEQVFLADVKRASTFRTSDELKEFLTHWREQVDREQGLSRHFSLYMFRNGIKPLWEHPQNIGGGSFYYIMSSNSRQEGVMLWLRLCADALDGKLDTDPPSKQLNGIAISIDKNISSKSSYFIKISVWNENCRAKKYIEHIRELLVTKYFGNCQLAYRRHETRIRRNKETTSPFVDPPKKSDESSSSASASDEDEKCDSVDDDAVNSPDRLSAEEEERQRAKAIALALAQEKARAEAEAEALALAQAQEVVASLPTPSTPVSSRREQEEEMEVEPLPEKRLTVSDPDSAIVVHRRVVMVQEEGEGEGAPEKVVIKTDCSDGVEPSLVRPRTLASRSAAPFLLPNYPSPSSLARLQANLATSFILVILAALMMMIALH